jgi:hypothetical protein
VFLISEVPLYLLAGNRGRKACHPPECGLPPLETLHQLFDRTGLAPPPSTHRGLHCSKSPPAPTSPSLRITRGSRRNSVSPPPPTCSYRRIGRSGTERPPFRIAINRSPTLGRVMHNLETRSTCAQVFCTNPLHHTTPSSGRNTGVPRS